MSDNTEGWREFDPARRGIFASHKLQDGAYLSVRHSQVSSEETIFPLDKVLKWLRKLVIP
jgi:hypothetical protein